MTEPRSLAEPMPASRAGFSAAEMEAAATGGRTLPLDRQLCFALYTASNRMTRLYRPYLGELGLTYPQYLVMLALWEEAPRTVGGLGRSLGLDFGTLSPLLKRMEAAGLVARRRDPADERQVLVALTEAGRRLEEQAARIPGRLACDLALPVEDLLLLRSVLDRFNQALEPGRDGS
jgi:DNA-binding MarR family transcriptional regulator